MSANPARIELLIDIFEHRAQRALALPHLTPAGLVEAILAEYRKDVEYLGDNPQHYELVRADTRAPLFADTPLTRQVGARTQLVLVECDQPLPAGAQPINGHAYLRELEAGTVYKLHWQPAIIGRKDEKLPQNDLVAVNLGAHPAGLRVSRRHAQIVADQGQYFVERLSQNPVSVTDSSGRSVQLAMSRHPLRSGDTLCLEGSQIKLRFLVRPEAAS